MQEFMMIFRFEPNTEYQPTEQEQTEMHKQWGIFIRGIATQVKLVSTHQLGFQGKVLQADKNITDGNYISNSKIVGGNMIVKANSLEDAVKMGKGCPILEIGGTVEVRDIILMDR